ncbi:MAG TPA: acetyl-CoA carboxylase biotin carboxyl carrier protein [Bacillota bacterium]|nr:acetyl-CoA carboxylase biotin carboxyl carrier protein [Bacillota bacterium]
MLKVQEIREIIRLIDESSINEFTYESNGTKVKLKKSMSGEIVQAAPSKNLVESTLEQPKEESKQTENKAVHIESEETVDEITEVDYDHEIVSPMVGTFYQAPSPESDPYVQKNSVVEEDTIVCIVEAMKLFNEIEAEVTGTIVDILVEDGELVEYGQPLFRVKKN